MGFWERFETKFEPEPNSGCWLWTASLSDKGYGWFHLGGRTEKAHRVAYRHFRGEVPEGKILDHRCGTPPCVNPDHLEPVTATENIRRGKGATKTHCKNGHLLAGDNLWWKKVNIPNRRNARRCRECTLASNKKGVGYRLLG